jgi:hypothetical protein
MTPVRLPPYSLCSHLPLISIFVFLPHFPPPPISGLSRQGLGNSGTVVVDTAHTCTLPRTPQSTIQMNILQLSKLNFGIASFLVFQSCFYLLLITVAVDFDTHLKVRFRLWETFYIEQCRVLFTDDRAGTRFLVLYIFCVNQAYLGQRMRQLRGFDFILDFAEIFDVSALTQSMWSLTWPPLRLHGTKWANEVQSWRANQQWWNSLKIIQKK